MTPTTLAVIGLAALSAATTPKTKSILGDWREPGGSVIRIAPCGEDVCARLIQISRQAPSRFDVHDPDPAKRTQRLCGLQIGYGFHLTDPAHADGGHLYDPKTGRTYHGTIARSGDMLMLRGYVGFKAFGRTEEWSQVPAPLTGSCS